MSQDYCPECENPLTATTDQLSNEDELTFLYCDHCGIYFVYDPYTNTITTKEDHDCPSTIETYHHKRTNGDRLELHHCPDCGFYAADNPNNY